MAEQPLPPFATPAQLAAYTNGKIAASDPNAQVMLDAVSAMFRRYCGWHIYPSLDLALTIDGEGGLVLELPSKYVTAVASIAEDGTALASDAYQWSQLGQVEKRYGKAPNCTPTRGGWWAWFVGYRSIDVAFTSGYEDPPAELLQLALSVAARGLSSPMGATREQAGQVSISWATTASGASGGLALLSNEQAILDVYRIVGV